MHLDWRDILDLWNERVGFFVDQYVVVQHMQKLFGFRKACLLCLHGWVQCVLPGIMRVDAWSPGTYVEPNLKHVADMQSMDRGGKPWTIWSGGHM